MKQIHKGLKALDDKIERKLQFEKKRDLQFYELLEENSILNDRIRELELENKKLKRKLK